MSIHKKTTKKKAMNVPEENAFWVNNGPIVRNLKELGSALRKMSGEQFDYHTKQGRNDFAIWTREILSMRGCATKLEKAKTKKGALSVIRSYS